MRKYFFLLGLFTLSAFAQQPPSVLYKRLQTRDDRSTITACLEISKTYAIAQPDSAVHYCNIAMQLAEKLNDRHSQALLLL